jgi:hypothetical protein
MEAGFTTEDLCVSPVTGLLQFVLAFRKLLIPGVRGNSRERNRLP